MAASPEFYPTLSHATKQESCRPDPKGLRPHVPAPEPRANLFFTAGQVWPLYLPPGAPWYNVAIEASIL